MLNFIVHKQYENDEKSIFVFSSNFDRSLYQRYFMDHQNKPNHPITMRSLKSFGILLLVLEAGIVILFCTSVRLLPYNGAGDRLANERYSAFQDVNVMMLIGFGFLMTFIKSYSWSALTYTFFINAIVMQLYLLLSGFWTRIFYGFATVGTLIQISMSSFTLGAYAVASVLIAFGGVIGRVGPFELLVMSLSHVIGYSLNQILVQGKIGAFDAGGSMTVHVFGAYFGLTVSLFLSKKIPPPTKPEASYVSNIFGMIGTLFLWLFWPSFNYAVFASNVYERTQIVSTTILSLTGSCIAVIVVNAISGRKFEMEDILNATLAGGVAIGSASGILYLPGIALVIGIIAGTVSTFGFRYLAAKLERAIGLYDTCGIHNLHAIPGLLGGIFSAIIVAAYNSGYDLTIAALYGPTNIFAVTQDFIKQGGLQIVGTLTSMGLGISFGMITGLILSHFYSERSNLFYQDNQYFNQTSDSASFIAKDQQSPLVQQQEKQAPLLENHD